MASGAALRVLHNPTAHKYKIPFLKGSRTKEYTKHGLVFTAVANITQAKLLLEKSTFQVNYDDNYNN